MSNKSEIKRAIFFLHYRAGSSYFQHLLGLTPDFLSKKMGLSNRKREEVYLTTNPPNQIIGKYIDCGSIEKVTQELGYKVKNFCILTHLGNWWGDLPSRDIPTPYGSPSPMKWSFVELFSPLYRNWKFITLVRDGRNIVASMRNLKGGYEEEKNKKDPEDFFISLCKAWRNQARVALDNQKVLLNRYKIFKFEDLKKEPIKVLNEIYQFSFSLDSDSIIIPTKIIQVSKIGSSNENTHSSFKDDSKMNERWKEWKEREIEIFNDICFNVQSELGYRS